jgi:hypothetical protein
MQALPKTILLGMLLFCGGVIIGLLANRWEIQASGPQGSLAWRLDRLTGHVELCWPGKPPECHAANKPAAN